MMAVPGRAFSEAQIGRLFEAECEEKAVGIKGWWPLGFTHTETHIHTHGRALPSASVPVRFPL